MQLFLRPVGGRVGGEGASFRVRVGDVPYNSRTRKRENQS